MSYLQLYAPDQDEISADVEPEANEPVIFRIEDYAALRRPRAPVAHEEPPFAAEESVERARVLHLNRRCPYCRHPVVTPVELRNGRMNRNRSMLPGTASLVGFQCGACYEEWPA